MNCTIMPRAVRAARLAEVELLTEGGLPPAQSTPAQPTHPRRWAAEAAGAPPKKRTKPDRLSSRVDLLTTELAQVKSLPLALHSGARTEHAAAPSPPMAELIPDDDVFSMAASATQFNEYDREGPSQASGPGSCTSAHASAQNISMC